MEMCDTCRGTLFLSLNQAVHQKALSFVTNNMESGTNGESTPRVGTFLGMNGGSSLNFCDNRYVPPSVPKTYGSLSLCFFLMLPRFSCKKSVPEGGCPPYAAASGRRRHLLCGCCLSPIESFIDTAEVRLLSVPCHPTCREISSRVRACENGCNASCLG
jgi:hypothetical protein